jgi:sec-independent protein translocase protein TatB
VFDVAFSELLVIAVVALLVIGPERLPKVARTLGALTGRMQRYVAQVKEEVNREVRFQELQQLQQEIQETASKTQSSIQQQVDQFSQDQPDLSNESQDLIQSKPEKDSN